MEVLGAVARGTEDVRRLHALVGAHSAAWLAFVARALPTLHRSPRVCAAVATAGAAAGAGWPVRLPLPPPALRAAAVLAAGAPLLPVHAAMLSHRRAEAVTATVVPLRTLAARLPRPSWAVLTGCFLPWLVFATAALVEEMRASPSDADTAARIDALTWLATFWFVCPSESPPAVFAAFAAALRRFVAAALAGSPPSTSPLPRYLRELCLTQCRRVPERNFFGLPA